MPGWSCRLLTIPQCAVGIVAVDDELRQDISRDRASGAALSMFLCIRWLAEEGLLVELACCVRERVLYEALHCLLIRRERICEITQRRSAHQSGEGKSGTCVPCIHRGFDVCCAHKHGGFEEAKLISVRQNESQCRAASLVSPASCANVAARCRNRTA